MTEIVLPYDANIIPQETGYNCGPASAQMCLSMRGQYVEEWVLAEECGTHQGGTDYVGLIENCLDPRLPEANYTSHDAPNDPPLEGQKEAFWDGVRRSIDNGFGIVMNWCAPPSNYPIGVKGSPNPSYGGGTVFHYVSCGGYSDEDGFRAIWVVDSGFWPWHYWISFDQCCTLIPPKAFCYANLPHVGEEVPPVSEIDVWNYEQLCGPVDPNTGYGTGWPQNGQNAEGQNLYAVDALAAVIADLNPSGVLDAVESHWSSVPDYAGMTLDQLAGPVTGDGERHGHPQLGGRSLNDGIAYVKTLLSEDGGGEPPLQNRR
jgi:hypothetical protein